MELDSRVSGDGGKAGRGSLFVEGSWKAQGKWQEAEGPVRKSGRASRALSDFVNNLTAGRRQAPNVQNTTSQGSPQVVLTAAKWAPIPTSGDIFEMLFPTCSDMEEAPKYGVELKTLDKSTYSMIPSA